MKKYDMRVRTVTAISATTVFLMVISTASTAYAGDVPAWVKDNAGWWADGTITDSEFISGLEFLISDRVIIVPPTTVDSSPGSLDVPAWVKDNAGWWADGTITDSEFVNGIEHLIQSGLISVSADVQLARFASDGSNSSDSVLAGLESELEKCSEIAKHSKRFDCEKPVEKSIMLYKYQKDAEHFELGSITYYWFGIGSPGNEFHITPAGQAILPIRMLVENTGSELAAIHCTSPLICAYDVSDGSNVFKYSGMDFTSGQIVMRPGEAKEFNILFGPNIGYGGTQFLYDPSKSYVFRINETFGSIDIPLTFK